MKHIVLAVLLALFMMPSTRADIIFDQYGTPQTNNAWEYYRAVGVGKGNSSTYIPRQEDYFGKEVLEGNVVYPGGGPSNPAAGWIHQEPSLYSEDTIRIFRTYVISDFSQSIPIHLGADDGHSIYLDGVFLGGGGFGVPVNVIVPLTAGVPHQLELLGYNGPGPWQLVFRRQDGAEFANTPGVHISTQQVPEPCSSTFMTLGVSILLSQRAIRNSRRRRLQRFSVVAS